MVKNKLLISLFCLTFVFLIALTTNFSSNPYLIVNWSNKSQNSEISILNWVINGIELCTATSVQENPQICSDGAGGAIIVWEDDRNGTNTDIYAQKINSSGQVQWTADGVEISTANYNQRYP